MSDFHWHLTAGVLCFYSKQSPLQIFFIIHTHVSIYYSYAATKSWMGMSGSEQQTHKFICVLDI